MSTEENKLSVNVVDSSNTNVDIVNNNEISRRATCKEILIYFREKYNNRYIVCSIVLIVSLIIFLSCLIAIPIKRQIEYENSFIVTETLMINASVVDQLWTCYDKHKYAYSCWLVDVTYGYRHANYHWPDWIVRYEFDASRFTKSAALERAILQYNNFKPCFISPKTGEPFNERPRSTDLSAQGVVWGRYPNMGVNNCMLAGIGMLTCLFILGMITRYNKGIIVRLPNIKIDDGTISRVIMPAYEDIDIKNNLDPIKVVATYHQDR